MDNIAVKTNRENPHLIIILTQLAVGTSLFWLEGDRDEVITSQVFGLVSVSSHAEKDNSKWTLTVDAMIKGSIFQ